MFRLGLVKGSYIPGKSIRILREYTRYRCKLVSCRSSEKNRYQNALTVCNVALDSVVSDIFGKSPHPLLIICLNNQGYKISLEYAIIDSPNGKREKIFNIYREVIL